jgi:hypothetical protein
LTPYTVFSGKYEVVGVVREPFCSPVVPEVPGSGQHDVLKRLAAAELLPFVMDDPCFGIVANKGEFVVGYGNRGHNKIVA